MKARQKKRIKDTAALVKNIKDMHDDMHALYTEYDLDLKDFLFSLADAKSKKINQVEKNTAAVDTGETDFVLVENDTKSTDCDNQSSNQDKNNRKKAPPKTKGKPPKKKIKDLYRAIMKICHPDKMNMEVLDEREYYRRKTALKICGNAYPKQDFEGLIFAAALVEIYVEGVSEKEYIENLNNLYSKYNYKITQIQKTLEWAWGTNWDTLESRYKIIEALAISRGINLPEKLSVIEKLVAHETK